MIRFALTIMLISMSIFTGNIKTSNATPWYEPTGLSPGDSYQLAFVTSVSFWAPGLVNHSGYDTTATLIASAADGLDAFNWYAILSTSDSTALNGATINGPVYNTHGKLVSNDASEFWSATHINPINWTEKGLLSHDERVWTGSNFDGSADSLGPPEITSGLINTTSSGQWMNAGTVFFTTYQPFYAVSSVIVVAAATVPEPTTIVLFGVGLLGVAGVSRRKN